MMNRKQKQNVRKVQLRKQRSTRSMVALLLVILTVFIAVIPSFAQETAQPQLIGVGEDAQVMTEENTAAQVPLSPGTTVTPEPSSAPQEAEQPQEATVQPQEEPQQSAQATQAAEQPQEEQPQEAVGSIGGSIWKDSNENGVLDAEAERVANYPVYLFAQEDKEHEIAVTTSKQDGTYLFENLAAGSYVVGIKEETMGAENYLLPPSDIKNDNKFYTRYEQSGGVAWAHTEPIAIDGNMQSNIDAGVRFETGIAPAALGDYNASDVAVINKMIQNNGLTGYALNAPDTWDFVIWIGSAPNKRVFYLTFIDKNISGHLDLRNLTSLTNMTCQNNNVTGLDLSGCTNLHTLSCAKNTPALTYLNVKGTKMTSVFELPVNLQKLVLAGGQTATVSAQTGGRAVIMQTNADYNNMTVQAFPDPGYVFDVWTTTGNPQLKPGNSLNNAQMSLYSPTNDVTFTAKFRQLVPPAVKTLAPTNVTQTTATLNGTLNLYGLTFQSGNFRIATDTGFTTGVRTFNFSNSATPSVNITGLTPNTTYYCRMEATSNGGSTVESTYVTFKTVGLSTSAATEVKQTTAKLNGTLSLSGNPFTSGVFRIATNTAFTQNVQTVPYTNSATPTATASGLTPNTTYYCRLEVTHSGSTTLTSPNNVTFTTLPIAPGLTTTAATEVKQTTAKLNGTMNLNGGTFSSGLFRVATNTAFTTGVKTVNFSNSATPSATITGLTANTTYYCRMEATSNGGTTIESNYVTFTTLPDPPTIVSTTASTVKQTTASLSGTVNLNGGTFASGLFRIAENASFTTNVKEFTFASLNGSTGSATATGLTANKTYYCRMEVTTNGGTGMTTPPITFTTQPDPPTLKSTDADDVKDTTAALHGTMNLNGGTFTSGLFRVATNSTFTTGVKTVAFTNSANPSATITGLVENTTYYCRMEATSNGGTTVETTYITFKTLPLKPTVQTEEATNITKSSATLRGTMNLNGGVFSSGVFRIAKDGAFTQDVREIPFLSSSSPSAVVTGLEPNTYYYYRIEATSNGGTSVATQVKWFLTLPLILNTENPGYVTAYSVEMRGTMNLNGGVFYSGVFRLAEDKYFTQGVRTVPFTNSANPTALIEGLMDNTTYYYRIEATHDEGTTISSDYKEITTLNMYHPDDVAAINALIDSCGLTGYAKDAPRTWDFAKWENGWSDNRVLELDLKNRGLTGYLSLGAFRAIKKADFSDNNLDQVSTNGDLNHPLETLDCSNNDLKIVNLNNANFLTSTKLTGNPNINLFIPSTGANITFSSTGGTVEFLDYNAATRQVQLQAHPKPGNKFYKWEMTGFTTGYSFSNAQTQYTILNISAIGGGISVKALYYIGATASPPTFANIATNSVDFSGTCKYNEDGPEISNGPARGGIRYKKVTDSAWTVLNEFSSLYSFTGVWANGGSYSGSLTGLSSSTEYEVQAKLFGRLGTSEWSESSKFTTLAASAPDVEIKPATNVQPTSATLNGTMNLHGGNFISGVFRIATDSAFTTGVRTVNFSNANNPSATITGLAENTKYYCRIEATNDGGTTISTNTEDFTTPYMYHPDDVALINTIIQNSDLAWTVDDPASWPISSSSSADHVIWDNSLPKRLTRIFIQSSNLTGDLDLSLSQELEYVYLNPINNSVKGQMGTLKAKNLPKLATLYIGSLGLEAVDLTGLTALSGLNITGNPKIHTLTKQTGDTVYIQAIGGGKVEFVDYNPTTEKFKLKAVPNTKKTLYRWSSSPLIPGFTGGTPALDVEFSAPSGNDTYIEATFGDLYHPDDVAAIDTIIDNSNLTWTKDDPASWPILNVKWDNALPKRLTMISLSNIALSGNLDLTLCEELKTIELHQNQLTGLDVSGLVNLENLNVRGNQLSSLEVSGATALQEINCMSNQLTSLNISSLVSLKRLVCHFNKLNGLDASGLAALQELNCSANELTSLEVSGCTALQQLHCDSNNLVSLDASNLPSLTNIWCFLNKLETLDVQNSTALEYLYCYMNELETLNVDGAVNLKSLNCFDNKLETLDISSLSSLESLICHTNKLKSLDMSGLSNLQNVDCSENELESVSIQTCSALLWLDVQDNPNINQFTKPNGDTVFIQATAGGKVVFEDFLLPDESFVLKAVANSTAKYLINWTCSPDALTYQSGSDTTNDITVTVPNGRDNTIVANFGDLYHPDDVAAINRLIQHNGLNWTYNDPASWDDGSNAFGYDAWSNAIPKRRQHLFVQNKNLSKDADLSPMVELRVVSVYGNDITSLDMHGLTNMMRAEINNLPELKSLNLANVGDNAYGPQSPGLGLNDYNFPCNNNPKLTEIIRGNGDKITLSAAGNGRVEFQRLYFNQRGVSVKAVPNASHSLLRWDSTSGSSLVYNSGTSTSTLINVDSPDGADDTITALFSGPPIVKPPTFTNIGTAGADFSGTYNPMGGTIYLGLTKYRYRRLGDVGWTTKTNLTYAGTTGSADQAYSGTLAGLLYPNTKYEVQVYFENEHGGTWSQSGEVLTKPNFVTWTAVASTSTPGEATVSGTYNIGNQPITGATIRYGTDPTLATGTTIALASGSEYTNSGFSYTLTGLTAGETYYVQTTVTNATGTTTSNIEPIDISCFVVVEYEEAVSQISLYPSPPAYLFAGNSTMDVKSYAQQLHGINSKDYYPVYYKVQGDSTEYPLSTLYTVTGHTTVTIYYVEADTNLSVSIPTQMLWAAFESDGGVVISPDHKIENHSARPVDVSLVSVGVDNADGVNFVQSIGGSNEVRLDISGVAGTEFAGMSLTGLDTSGTALGAAGKLGRLGGGITPALGNTGKFRIGGEYQGGFYTPTTSKQPKLNALLRLNLDMS